MATLPEKLECIVTRDGVPVAGVVLHAKFTTVLKNSYTLPFGLTDAHGRASLERREVLEWCESERKLAMIDYVPLEGSFAGDIYVCVMSADDIRRALEGYGLFKRFFPYPIGYRQSLDRGLETLQRINVADLYVEASAKPPVAKVHWCARLDTLNKRPPRRRGGES